MGEFNPPFLNQKSLIYFLFILFIPALSPHWLDTLIELTSMTFFESFPVERSTKSTVLSQPSSFRTASRSCSCCLQCSLPTALRGAGRRRIWGKVFVTDPTVFKTIPRGDTTWLSILWLHCVLEDLWKILILKILQLCRGWHKLPKPLSSLILCLISYEFAGYPAILKRNYWGKSLSNKDRIY